MSKSPVTLITGGAGFVGTNLAHRLALSGRDVLIFDNLSREGVGENLEWLVARHPARVSVLGGDVRDAAAVRKAVEHAGEVYHLAAQVAVTTSLDDPAEDFEINARGTLNLLEAIRTRKNPPSLVYTSTNKVYGALPDVDLTAHGSRYVPVDMSVRMQGVDEKRPLDFHSPYGCSKGCADQYVLDYSRSFCIPAVVFRMSCIYGPHQKGNEDQGWVAHFLMRARANAPVTIFGDGLQVRDALFVDDLVDALTVAMKGIARLSGHAFNIGGGPANTLSLLELISWLGEHGKVPPVVLHASPRPGDQKYYVSNTTKFYSATGWHARVRVPEGLMRLSTWLTEANSRPHAAMPARESLSRLEASR